MLKLYSLDHQLADDMLYWLNNHTTVWTSFWCTAGIADKRVLCWVIEDEDVALMAKLTFSGKLFNSLQEVHDHIMAGRRALGI